MPACEAILNLESQSSPAMKIMLRVIHLQIMCLRMEPWARQYDEHGIRDDEYC
jgi:hypothetical protein